MKSVCAFGDSVLRGVVLDNDKYKLSPNSFSNLCKKTLGICIENKAKFGSTVSTGKKSIERNIDNLENEDYDYVILEFGGNDCDFNWKEISDNPDLEYEPNSTIEDFKKVYTELINKIKSLGKIPVIMSLPPIDGKRYFEKISKNLNASNILKWMCGNKQFIADWHERYNLETFKLAIRNNVSIIDITSKFLECKNYERFLCADGIHPNEKGHQIIAREIQEHLQEKNIKL